jgi:hypothetical protein
MQQEEGEAFEVQEHPCEPEHALHCCHTAVTDRGPSGRSGYWMYTFKCVDCGKRSRSCTIVKG